MRTLLKNGNILFGDELELLKNMDLLIESGKIIKIEKNIDVECEKTIDVTGNYICPGLIDLHVHLVWDSTTDPVTNNQLRTHDEILINAIANARTYLKYGITTVRDLGSNDDIAITISKAIEQGLIEGPNVICAGKTLTMTGGHDPFWARFIDGENEALKGVREQIFKGATVIKVSATGGVYGRSKGEKESNTELNHDELEVICNEAHKFGLKVASHAIGYQGIKNSLLAGVDTIEHGHYMDDTLINLMNERNVAWIPTLFVYKQVAFARGVPEYASIKAKNIVKIHKRAFEKFNKDVLIGAGSDAGSPGVAHSSGLINEIYEINNIKKDNKESLKTATVNAGKILDENIGTIEKGYYADLIVLEDNPLDDIRNLESVIDVIINRNY